MKALVVKHFGNPPVMVVEERSIPSARAGFTLVRMHSATINQLSNTIRKGEFGALPVPFVLGNEGSGVVEQSGRFKPGTRVMIYGSAKLGIVQDGLFQQWVAVEDHRISELPDTLTWEEGSALPVNYLTAYRTIGHVAKLQANQTVLISGATGSVGHALVQVTMALGARPISVVSSAAKAQRAREAGAGAVIDLSSQKLPDAVFDLTGGAGADIAVDPVGGPRLSELLRSVRRGGRVISLGFTGGREPTIDVLDLIANDKSIIGYGVFAESDDVIYKALVELAALAGKGELKPVIDTVVTLEDFERGYSRLASREAVGSVALRL